MTKKVKCSTCSKGWCKNHIFEFTASTNKDSVMPNMKRRLCPRYNPYIKWYLETPAVFAKRFRLSIEMAKPIHRYFCTKIKRYQFWQLRSSMRGMVKRSWKHISKIWTKIFQEWANWYILFDVPSRECFWHFFYLIQFVPKAISKENYCSVC